MKILAAAVRWLIAKYIQWEDRCCGHDPEELKDAIPYLPPAELVDGVWVRNLIDG